ncbi:PH domain-containing protein [Candidatus Saccharibacteria bacterium]|nr:PH domain-containing protein [Candidatus Saccharibacteria bacterium]
MDSEPNSSDKLTPELQVKHDDSVRLYPEIQFSDTEYVVIDIQRTIWGLVMIWAVAIASFAVIALFAAAMVSIADVDPFIMFMIVVGLGILCLAGGATGHYVFRRNIFIVTNERIFSRIQLTPFSYRAQNVEIDHIEDCSFTQNGIVQMLFNYGTIRLSTVGDEHTYVFTFVARPEEQFKVANHVVQIVDEKSPIKYRH